MANGTHSAVAINRVAATEMAMEIQALAMRRQEDDLDETEDLQELAILGANLEAIAHRCIRRDEAENRDHREMQRLGRRICQLLERIDSGALAPSEAAA